MNTAREPSVSFIVPARNEAGTIRTIVENLPRLGGFTEIVFIENGSHDSTLDVIKSVAAEHSYPVRIIYDSITCRGKVEAVIHGLRLAHGDIAIIYDADMTVTPDETVLFYEAVKTGAGTLANGSRLVYAMEKDAMRGLNYIGNRLYAAVLSILLRQQLTDTLCGTKAFWLTDYERMKVARTRYHSLDPFGDFDFLLGAGLLGMKIVEIPVHYKARTYGVTNIRRIRDGWRLFQMLAIACVDIGRFWSRKS